MAIGIFVALLLTFVQLVAQHLHSDNQMTSWKHRTEKSTLYRNGRNGPMVQWKAIRDMLTNEGFKIINIGKFKLGNSLKYMQPTLNGGVHRKSNEIKKLEDAILTPLKKVFDATAKVLFQALFSIFKKSNSTRRAWYKYDKTKCRVYGSRILCGYDENKEDLKSRYEPKNYENGCREKNGRVDCNYVKGTYVTRKQPRFDNGDPYICKENEEGDIDCVSGLRNRNDESSEDENEDTVPFVGIRHDLLANTKSTVHQH